MLWYKAGVETTQCHKVKLLDQREILVCLGTEGGQGIVSTELVPGGPPSAKAKPDGRDG